MGYLEVMNLYDVRMMKGSNKLCFALETCDEVRVFLQVRMENLNGDVALQLSIASLQNLRHTTLSQPLQQFVFPKTLWVCTHDRLLIRALVWSLQPYRAQGSDEVHA